MGSTGKERFLRPAYAPNAAYNGWDDMNELSEEDIWGEGLPSGECKEHVYVHQTCIKEEVHALESSRVTFNNNSARSRLSVEMETEGFRELGRSGAAGLATFAHMNEGRVLHGGRMEETTGGLSRSKVNIKQLGNGITAGHHARQQQQQQQQSHAAQSAPMKVPRWAGNSDNEEEDEEGRLEVARLPPHELIAREHAKSQAMSFSGSGRTLKGMDLRRLRSAVWSRTGFMD